MNITSRDPDIICLQEVGGFGAVLKHDAGAPGPLSEIQMPQDRAGELDVFTILGSDSLDSHLAQMILLQTDSLDHVVCTAQGLRYIAAMIELKEDRTRLWICSVHLPHSSNSDEDFESAVSDLGRFLGAHIRERILVMGDFSASSTSY